MVIINQEKLHEGAKTMQTLHKLSNRIFYLSPYQPTDRPILGAIVGKNHTLLIDAGNSSQHAKLFIEQLSASSIKVDMLILTHWHWDHVFGLSEIGIPSIANSRTLKKIMELQNYSWEDKELDERVESGIEIPFCANAIKLELGSERNVHIPNPSIIFEKELQLNLGGVTCIIERVDCDHSMDSNLIYIPEEKALFLGDCLYANMYAEKWHYTILRMEQLLKKIKSYDAETYFLSHHPAPLTRESFHEFTSLLKKGAYLTRIHHGNLEAISIALSAQLQRELTEEDMEIIHYFVNGYE